MVGYGSVFLVKNLGNAYLLFHLEIFILGVYALLARYKIFSKVAFVQKRINKIAERSFWNSTISYLHENYLIFSVGSLIGVRDTRIGK